MGTCAITVNHNAIMGAYRACDGTLSLSTSYAPGAGDSVATANFGLNSLRMLLIDWHRDGLVFQVNTWNGGIRAFNPQGIAAGGVGAMTFSVMPNAGAVTVTGAVAKDIMVGTMTGGVGVEVSSGTNLSQTVINFFAIGT